MLSLILAEKIQSLFVMMAMGFALVKAGFVKPQDSRAISMLNLYVINPCMIISSFQVDMTQEVRLGFLVAVIGALSTQGLFLVLTTVFKKPLKLDEVEQASLTYSNCGNLIIPLVVMIMGQDMVIYCTAYLVVQTISYAPHPCQDAGRPTPRPLPSEGGGAGLHLRARNSQSEQASR